MHLASTISRSYVLNKPVLPGSTHHFFLTRQMCEMRLHIFLDSGTRISISICFISSNSSMRIFLLLITCQFGKKLTAVAELPEERGKFLTQGAVHK